MKRGGMHVTLADISIAYLATFGEKHPDTMTYARAGELVREAHPVSWRRVFELAEEERSNTTDYAAAAERLRARITIEGQQ